MPRKAARINHVISRDGGCRLTDHLNPVTRAWFTTGIITVIEPELILGIRQLHAAGEGSKRGTPRNLNVMQCMAGTRDFLFCGQGGESYQ